VPDRQVHLPGVDFEALRIRLERFVLHVEAQPGVADQRQRLGVAGVGLQPLIPNANRLLVFAGGKGIKSELPQFFPLGIRRDIVIHRKHIRKLIIERQGFITGRGQYARDAEHLVFVQIERRFLEIAGQKDAGQQFNNIARRRQRLDRDRQLQHQLHLFGDHRVLKSDQPGHQRGHLFRQAGGGVHVEAVHLVFEHPFHDFSGRHLLQQGGIADLDLRQNLHVVGAGEQAQRFAVPDREGDGCALVHIEPRRREHVELVAVLVEPLGQVAHILGDVRRPGDQRVAPAHQARVEDRRRGHARQGIPDTHAQHAGLGVSAQQHAPSEERLAVQAREEEVVTQAEEQFVALTGLGGKRVGLQH